MKKSEYWVVITVIACALLVLGAFTVGLGRFSLNPNEKIVRVRFESVAGINMNSVVKYAGANVGHVKSIRVLPRAEQKQGPNGPYCIELACGVNPDVELGADVTAKIDADSLLGAKYVSLTPGKMDAPPLPDDAVLAGLHTDDLQDIAGPAKELIAQLKPIAEKLQPVAMRLDTITAKLDDSLPSLLENMDAILHDGNQLMATVNTPDGRERITRLLANLRTVSDNLKVVSSNAKALTTTLAEKPWRLIWGGKVHLPTEEKQVLATDKVIPTAPLDNPPGTAPAKVAATRPLPTNNSIKVRADDVGVKRAKAAAEDAAKKPQATSIPQR
jgi:virulence factor Mce-like protein